MIDLLYEQGLWTGRDLLLLSLLLSLQIRKILRPSYKMRLSEIGEIADKYWLEIPEHFPFVKLDVHVVMPNHMHGIIIIDKPDDGRNDGKNKKRITGQNDGNNIDANVERDVGRDVERDVGRDEERDVGRDVVVT